MKQKKKKYDVNIEKIEIDEGARFIKYYIIFMILIVILLAIILLSGCAPFHEFMNETDTKKLIDDTINTGGNPLGLLSVGIGLLLGWYKRKAIINTLGIGGNYGKNNRRSDRRGT